MKEQNKEKKTIKKPLYKKGDKVILKWMMMDQDSVFNLMFGIIRECISTEEGFIYKVEKFRLRGEKLIEKETDIVKEESITSNFIEFIGETVKQKKANIEILYMKRLEECNVFFNLQNNE